MSAQSYRQYLDFLDNTIYKKSSKLKKTLLVALVSFLLIIGASSAFLVYYSQKITKADAQSAYLDLASGGFYKTGQSLDELTVASQVAGAKTTLTAPNLEATSGYLIKIEKSQKILAQIEAVKSNVSFQKKALQKTTVPPAYISFNKELINFYGDCLNSLDKIYKENQFISDVQSAIGPNPYLISFSDESLWKEAKIDKIENYYKNLKTEANKAQLNLTKLNVPESFRTYYNAQLTYVTLLTKVSDNILATLAKKDQPVGDAATKLEEAYQILTGAKRENEVISQQISTETDKLTAPLANANGLATVRIKQNTIAEKFNSFIPN